MRSGLAILVLSGCGRIGFEPSGGDAPDNVVGDDSAVHLDVVPVGCTPVAGCPAASQSFTPSTSTSKGTNSIDHGYVGSCGGAAGGENTVLINVVETGHYTIKGVGGTTLYVRDECCSGAERVCTTTGMLQLALTAGDQFVVFLDDVPVGMSAQLQFKGAP
jgi:hypothetical protein